MPDQSPNDGIARSQVVAFFRDGVKVRAKTVHTPKELHERLRAQAEVYTVNEDPNVKEEMLQICFSDNLLFYAIQPVKQESGIVIAPANTIPRVNGA